MYAHIVTFVQLNGGTLDGAQLSVTADSLPEDDHNDAAHTADGTPIAQHDKPRAGSTFDLFSLANV